jgi:hypothetical protein
MYNNENLMTFTLEQDGIVSSKALRGRETWIEHLQEFLYFLEGAGYEGVRRRVAIDTGVFNTDELGWYGATFDAADEN